MNKYKDLRQYLSNFLTGPNIDAILNSLGDEMQRQEDLSVAVHDQLTISTASGVYLDKRLSEVGITRPPELGMDDLAFRQMGIQVNATKQVTEVVHTVLSTFYGDETVRASAISNISGPYVLEDGDDLIFALEDGQVHVLTVKEADFQNISDAQTEEVVDIITRYIRENGYNGYAQTYLDIDTEEKYVKIFGGARGPFSFVQILGGKLQNKLEFPEVRGTDLPLNTTVWEITRNAGSRHRFRWVSGPQPLLDKVIPGDSVMIYGGQFVTAGIEGTFPITTVRPTQPAPAVNAGYFEIELAGFNELTSSLPDANPPPNTITDTYSITLTQASFDDLKFFLPKKNTSYSQLRYALAWEPADLLRIYMPATTKVVRRDLEGSGHLHLLYSATEFNGSFGSATDAAAKIHVLSDVSISYPQAGTDALAYGGTLQVTSPFTATLDIDYIFREGQRTHVFTKTPHGISGVIDSYGREIADALVVTATALPQDDAANKFLGPYMVDPEAGYTLTDTVVSLRETVLKGDNRQTLLISGALPPTNGILLFSLNRDEQEGPVKYFTAQTANSSATVNIGSISQVATTVTVSTVSPHGATIGDSILIAGTVNFNGSWTVTSVSSPTVLQFAKTPAAVLFETAGTLQPLLLQAVSTITIDPSYTFKFTHEPGTDISLLSSERPYEPDLTGLDYAFYATGTADGRAFAEELIRQIMALGINLEIIIVYPQDIGLGNEGGSAYVEDPPTSEKVFIWGGDND